MPDEPDPQPALVLVPAQRLGEPRGLRAADHPVAVLQAVRARDGGVEPGDHGAQFGHREERPGLVGAEDDVESLVQLAEQPAEMAPLGPVRGLRADLVGLAGVEVRLAGGVADVLVPRDD
ncbi:hypothetical protein SSBG_05875 [Streptomyces sp. SPB074]|nr:hypothetical protein SSBG_05875 [Streptomyces sp. SPB074]